MDDVRSCRGTAPTDWLGCTHARGSRQGAFFILPAVYQQYGIAYVATELGFTDDQVAEITSYVWTGVERTLQPNQILMLVGEHGMDSATIDVFLSTYRMCDRALGGLVSAGPLPHCH